MHLHEGMRQSPRNLMQRLTPLPGKVDKRGWQSLVQRVHRPYYRISKQQYDGIVKLSEGADVVLLDGLQQCSFGDADGGYALMPLHKPL